MALILALAALHALSIAPDIVLADFEGSDYGSWVTTGEAFGRAPARGTLPNQMKVTGYAGEGLANSFLGGDDSIGTLASPEFKISRRFLTFLIGGGGWDGKTCLNLIVDGRTVLSGTGPNTQPGGREALAPMTWDLREFAGKSAKVVLVDDASGGWGHINADQIVLTDRPAKLPVAPKRTMKIEKRYLNLPVQHDAPLRHVTMTVDGKVIREFEINLAEGKPDFWAFLDMTEFKGRTVEINSKMVSLTEIEQSDALKDSANLYREASRPQFHFSTKRGWLNDPNGLVYYDGEYHLYYQYDPYSWGGNLKHWGHAVSTDLVHWIELPTAIYPHHFGDAVWSGSAAVDWKNSSGFKTGKNDVIIAAYTSIDRGECIVYSNDRGRTFNEFSGNPVIKHVGRDPRLFWHQPSGKWVIAVYDELPDRPQGISFYDSPDLKTWTFQSRIDGFFECPDIFELPVDGDKARTKWVLTAANSEYMLGHFDGKVFTPETPKLPGHRGDAFYAAQTFNDIPARDGRRIQIGWATIATPGMPFNQMMAFPCEMTLRTTSAGVRMFWEPVKEIASLHAREVESENVDVQPGTSFDPKMKGDLLDVSVSVLADKASSVTFSVRGMPIVYDAVAGTLSCGGRTHQLSAVPQRAGSEESCEPAFTGLETDATHGLHPFALTLSCRGRSGDGSESSSEPSFTGLETDATRGLRPIAVRILVDRTSVEIFADGGQLYMPMAGHFKQGAKAFEILASGGGAQIVSFRGSELKSSWR